MDLPPSMRPLVYDFGQLTDKTEEDYTRQLVSYHVRAPFCHDAMYVNTLFSLHDHCTFQQIILASFSVLSLASFL